MPFKRMRKCFCLAFAALMVVVLLPWNRDQPPPFASVFWQDTGMRIRTSLGSIAAVLLFMLRYAAPQHAITDDGNSILNSGLNSHIFQNLGQYSPRFTVANDSVAPPAGCVVEVVDNLERHGSRQQTARATRAARRTLDKIQEAMDNSHGCKLPPELAFLPHATLMDGTGSLVPFGALQYVYTLMLSLSQSHKLTP